MAIGQQDNPTFATISVAVTASQIADQMVTFIESGFSRFWCSGVFLETPGSYVLDQPGSQIWYANPELYAADDWMIRVVEDEEETGDPEDGKAHLISKKEFTEGLTKLATADNGAYAHHLNDIIRDNGDAATADILMQFICFGKEVYA